MNNYANPRQGATTAKPVTYPSYVMRKDNRGQWRWTYYARNAEPLAVSSESYINRSDCEHCIALVKGSASDPVYYID